MKVIIMRQGSLKELKVGDRYQVAEVTKTGYKVKTKSGTRLVSKDVCVVIEE